MPSFPPSALATNLLKGKKGIEIGGSQHNSFYLDTLNVDFTDEFTVFKQEEVNMCGDYMRVDVVANGNELPFKDNEWDFVINSHVLEHFFDPIKAIKEWMRVIKPGGYVYMIVPHKERTFDRERERTTIQELIARHNGVIEDPKTYHHHNVWVTQDVIDLCKAMELNVIAYQDVDDKARNGFTVVIQK